VSEKLHGRLDVCVGHLKDLGFNVVEGSCLRENNKHVSASRTERVKDLITLWEADEVKAILVEDVQTK
jgi:muramoyltetrapeptide carboxypeptidase LdcA involved in peptidoglycan recycling